MNKIISKAIRLHHWPLWGTIYTDWYDIDCISEAAMYFPLHYQQDKIALTVISSVFCCDVSTCSSETLSFNISGPSSDKHCRYKRSAWFDSRSMTSSY